VTGQALWLCLTFCRELPLVGIAVTDRAFLSAATRKARGVLRLDVQLPILRRFLVAGSAGQLGVWFDQLEARETVEAQGLLQLWLAERYVRDFVATSTTLSRRLVGSASYGVDEAAAVW
jgi:hypothetical protein